MTSGEWREIGKVLFLQLQLQPLKVGDVQRYYRPHDALYPVDRFTMERDGISAMIDGKLTYDAHHVRHPVSRNRISNPISIGFTSHYREMQARFGPHMTLGIAGENIIIETDEILTEADMTHGIAFESPTGERIEMDLVFAIPPCKPFAKYCLQTDEIESRQLLVRETLQYLAKGIRGFCAEPADGERYSISPGHRFWLLQRTP